MRSTISPRPGQDDDPDTRLLAQRAGQGQPVLSGQHQIQNDEIDRGLRHQPCASRRRLARSKPGNPRRTDIPERDRRFPADRRQSEYDRCHSCRPTSATSHSGSGSPQHPGRRSRDHAFEHHTYSYKILQKTAAGDIIGLRPTLHSVAFGSAVAADLLESERSACGRHSPGHRSRNPAPAAIRPGADARCRHRR